MNEVGAAQLFTLQQDHWLSDRLGCSAWRVSDDGEGQPLSLLDTHTPQFAYTKIAVENIRISSHLQNLGFRTVDTALNFSGLPSGETAAGVRPAVAGDRDAVTAIAGESFRFSRFHLDPRVPRATADAIKAAWAANFFEGQRGDGMLVAEDQGRIAGFLQLLWSSDDCLVIDLIGVAPPFQGRGIARRMIQHAARHGTGAGRAPQSMRVGTQTANIPSVRLYESLGFRLASAQHVLHHHGTGGMQ